VIMADCQALAVSSSGNTGLAGYVSERAIAVVAIQRVAQRRLWIEEVALSAIAQINVHPSIIVIVKKRATGSSGYGQVLYGRSAAAMHPADPTPSWRHLLKRVGHGHG